MLFSILHFPNFVALVGIVHSKSVLRLGRAFDASHFLGIPFTSILKTFLGNFYYDDCGPGAATIDSCLCLKTSLMHFVFDQSIFLLQLFFIILYSESHYA